MICRNHNFGCVDDHVNRYFPDDEQNNECLSHSRDIQTNEGLGYLIYTL